jgi:hypothetical protein
VSRFILLNPSTCHRKATDLHPLAHNHLHEYSCTSFVPVCTDDDQKNWTSSFLMMEEFTCSARSGAWSRLMCLRSSRSIARNTSRVFVRVSFISSSPYMYRRSILNEAIYQSIVP